MARSKWPQVQKKLILVEAWARDGLTDCQIAKNLGIGESTLNKYKLEHPEFSESLKKGKEVVDVEVENALFKRAIGYKCKEEKTEVDETGHKKITTTTKEVIPDTTAQIFWLKNRKPDKWKDRQPENQNTVETKDDPITQSLKEDFEK